MCVRNQSVLIVVRILSRLMIGLIVVLVKHAYATLAWIPTLASVLFAAIYAALTHVFLAWILYIMNPTN